MALLTLHRNQLFKLSIPYWVFIDEQPVGIMQGREVNIHLPEGSYNLSIRIMFQPFKWRFNIGGSKNISISTNEQKQLWITDRERWWNILFDIDLMLWLAKFFFELRYPYDMMYEILSNGFFAVWILRIWMIRDRYFILKVASINSHHNV